MNATLKSRIQMLTNIVDAIDTRTGGNISDYVRGIVAREPKLHLAYAEAAGSLMAHLGEILFHARGVVEAAGLDVSPVCCNLGSCRALAEVPESELVEMLESLPEPVAA